MWFQSCYSGHKREKTFDYNQCNADELLRNSKRLCFVCDRKYFYK